MHAVSPATVERRNVSGRRTVLLAWKGKVNGKKKLIHIKYNPSIPGGQGDLDGFSVVEDRLYILSHAFMTNHEINECEDDEKMEN